MNRLILAALVVLVGFLVPPAEVAAQASRPVRIGFVNLDRLLQVAPQAQSVSEGLREEFLPREREIEAMQTDLTQRRDQFQNDREVMGAEERVNAERELRDGARDLERRQKEYLEDLNLRRNEELAKLQKQLLGVVQAYAKETGYDLIVGPGVLYFSPGVDITGQILSRLEQGGTTSGNGE